MCAQPVPDWLIPPPEGFRAEDLDALPDLPPHTELIDGSLVLVSPRKGFHSTAIDLLVMGLRRTVPDHYRVRREMTVTLGSQQRPEPDLMVVDTSAVDEEQTSFAPESVTLAAEVVSPESVARDRDRKPVLYARSGIPHYWRVEQGDDGPVVYVYELDSAGPCYGLTGIHHKRLALDAPYPIDIDLTEISRL
ncbi:Uma2 family endonuclease [Nocardiopsis sp. NRRL B-16309]|uniref:Uma2 family endonuclease n=1 Tax=Nocardiopsis sp. NRRL B-16309 TaxID=1519494 RepID=UPI0006AF01C2|nr:Uma2 family endonuclease [Nocardiopsis sp. NRRL B-16309]KOX15712.1 restriction endonuclease [Nocardiopsis sp. NRRL B-16309]